MARRPLALIGFMGSGKSTVGVEVARITRSSFVDLDREIAADLGRSIADIFQERGEAAFRRKESELLGKALEPGNVVALGGGAPLDDSNWAEVSGRAVSVWLDVPFDWLWPRLELETGRPLLVGRSRDEVFALFEARLARYSEADHRVDGARDPGTTAREVARLWSG